MSRHFALAVGDGIGEAMYYTGDGWVFAEGAERKALIKRYTREEAKATSLNPSEFWVEYSETQRVSS